MQTIFLNAIPSFEIAEIFIQISLKYVPEGPIHNDPTLVQIMAWSHTGDKLLSEPKMALFTDAYVHYSASEG